MTSVILIYCTCKKSRYSTYLKAVYSRMENIATIKMRNILVLLSVGLMLFGACNTSGKKAPDTNLTAKADTRPQPNVKLKSDRRPVKIGNDSEVLITSTTAEPRTRIFFFNLHDNENTAVEAAAQIIATHGGTLLEFRHDGERLISFDVGTDHFKFDPNRMFSAVGIAKDLIKHGPDSPQAREAVAGFGRRIVNEYIEPNRKLVVTVHNNTNDGGLTVNSYVANTGETAEVFSSPDQDIDDFFIVTEKDFFTKLKSRGFNVVLQDTERIKSDDSLDDGSLSIYCGRNGIPYVNVESEHGHLEQQVKMLEAIDEIVSGKR